MRFWLGLGSNRGDRGAALPALLDRLAAAGVAVEAVSPVYETSPQERDDQPEFLNAAARVRSDLDPVEMLRVAKEIEGELGRRPGPRYGPRPVDCDLLLWEGGVVAVSGLEVPHPRLGQRRFALVPLLDLDPGLTLPDGRRLADLEAELDPEDQRVEPTSVELTRPGI